MSFDLVYTACPNGSTEPVPIQVSFITASFSIALFLVTVPTNLLVCLAILIDPYNKLKTQFNCFTFNLALADLLVGCVTESISIYVHMKEGVDTENGDDIEPAASKALHIQYFISAMASVLSIAALALERYLAVSKPFLYRQYFSVKLAVVMSAFIWLVAIGFGLTNIFVEYILESFIFVNTAVLLTCAIVGFACFEIRSSLRRVSNDWAALEIQTNSQRNSECNQKKLTKTFALIIGALLCCYVPACCLIYFMNLCQTCDCELIEWFRDIAFWLVLLNSAINPFIYAFRNESFRKAVRIIICCKCRRRMFYLQRQIPKDEDNKTSNKRAKPSPRHATYGSISTKDEEDIYHNV